MAKKYTRTNKVFELPIFFKATMVLFVIESLWFALSGAFSMPYDENTHLGIIRIYSSRLLPFWSQQPVGADSLGAINRDPSYLYHYLISFPYRLFAHFFHSQTQQVIFLRFISIGLMFWALVLFRKVLLNTKASRSIVNVVMALLVLTPVVPSLASQINYDNLVILFVAASLLQVQKIIDGIKISQRVKLQDAMVLVVLCTLGSIVKYAFIPVFIGMGIYVAVSLFKLIRQVTSRVMLKDLQKQFKAFSGKMNVFLTILVLASIGLFAERYVINTIQYGTPTPECNQVLSVDRCLNYSPWRRNYLTYQDKITGKLEPIPTNPVNYAVKIWGKRITNELFFIGYGTSSTFITYNPLGITRMLSVATIIFGLVLFIRWQRELRRKFKIDVLLSVTIVYILVLWLQNYADFLHLGYPFAIQGRYLVPVLPIIYLLLALGFARLLQFIPRYKPYIAWAAIAVLITQGGGVGLYILKSQPSWYWPNSYVLSANNAARSILSRFTITN